jgi:phosphoribosylaminoimidazole-succinocarboxamide synthase
MSVLHETNFNDLPLLHRGKVRDMYGVPENEEMLLMVATDRISAYDVVMAEPIPGKGKILTQLSTFWFSLLGDVCKNHLISAEVAEYPDICRQYADQLSGRSMLIAKTKPLPVECIVRGYLSGSFWKAYQSSPVVCGFTLPAGMSESDRFAESLFTPSTKAEQGLHDENISIAQMEELIGAERTRQLAQVSLQLYERAAEYARDKGIIIADTKFEFGIKDDELVLIDEVLTPDSSRFWPMETYQTGRSQPSFDKQFLRDYLSSLSWDKNPPPPSLPAHIIDKTSERYEEAAHRIIG